MIDSYKRTYNGDIPAAAAAPPAHPLPPTFETESHVVNASSAADHARTENHMYNNQVDETGDDDTSGGLIYVPNY